VDIAEAARSGRAIASSAPDDFMGLQVLLMGPKRSCHENYPKRFFPLLMYVDKTRANERRRSES